MQSLKFWHECIGKLISPDSTPEQAITHYYPTRTLKGVKPSRLGAGIDVFYIASPGNSFLISKIELPNQPGLALRPSEDCGGEKLIAQWLVHDAPTDAPWMVGVIGNANPVKSLKLCQPPVLCAFSGANAGFDFDLGVVREAVKIIGELDWKKSIAPALHTYQSRLHANDIGDSDRAEREGKKLSKMFEKTPNLKRSLIDLTKLTVKPGSGEYQVLSWYNRVR